MATRLQKIALAVSLLASFFLGVPYAQAAIAVPFSASSTDAGRFSPNAINGNFPRLLIGATTSTATAIPGLTLYGQNSANCNGSDTLVLGGNPSGDTDFWFCRNSNNDGIDNDVLQIGTTTVPGSNPFLTFTRAGFAGFGTTTPNHQISIFGTGTNTSLTTTADSELNIINGNSATNNNSADFAFDTNDTGNVLVTGAKIAGQFTSHSLGAVSGDLVFLTRNAGTLAEKMRLNSAGILTVTNLGSGTVNANAGSLYSTATSTPTAGTGISYSGTFGSLIGGTSGSITNTGLISATCSGGTTCSGTNPLAISSFSYPFPSNATTTNLTMSNGLTIGEANALTFGGTNTGILGTNAGGLRFEVGGGIKFRVDNNVEVGFDSTGSSKFNVSGNTSLGSGYVSTAAPTDGLIVQGLAGFGTTSPTQQLSIQGNELLSGNLSLANLTATGTATLGNLTLSGITGSTQCLNVNTSGVVSGTGSVCGSGGTGTNFFTNVSANTFLNTGTNLQAPTINATSTTATSTFAGDVWIGSNSVLPNPDLRIGTSSVPLYGRVAGDVIDAEYDANEVASINVANANIGSCAASTYFADGNNPTLGGYYGTFSFLNDGWTNGAGAGCGIGVSNLDKPEAVAIASPTGEMDFDIASTSQNGAADFNWNVNNVTQMKLTNSGRLGIATVTPAAEFSLAAKTNNTSNPLILVSSTTAAGTSADMFFKIDSVGRVNLGTNQANGQVVTFANGNVFISNTGNALTWSGAAGNQLTMTSASAGAIPFTIIGVGGTQTGNLAQFQKVNGSNLDVINANGLLGIGTTSPFAKLSIQANPNDPAVSTTLFAIGSSTASATTTLFSVNNTGSVFAPALATNGTADAVGRITATGQLVDCGGATCTISNSRAKHDIQTLNASDIVSQFMELRPVHYVLNGSNIPQYGLIAQEVQKLFPDAVDYATTDVSITLADGSQGIIKKGDPKTVDYQASITSLNTLMIQHEQDEIDALGGFKKSMTDDWQWYAIGFLAFWNLLITGFLILKRKK